MGVRTWPIFDQEKDPDPQRDNLCGETAAAMILEAGGVHAVPDDIVGALGHSGVTNGGELAGVVRTAGAEVIENVGASWLSDLVGDTLELLLIADDDDGDPTRSSNHGLHWIVAYNNNGGSVQCANPYGARDIAYETSLLGDAIHEAIVVRWPGQAANHQSEEDDMEPIIKIDDKQGNIFYADGPFIQYAPTQQAVRDIEWVAAKIRNRPIANWGDAGVGADDVDIRNVYKPIDAHTAAVLGLPFP